MDNMKVNSDPMMEIFLEECGDLVTQYETYLGMASEKNEYDLNLINEIFRITHTIKADATMMLFECVAVPARAFERLLYFYRDECSNVNFKEFSDMLSKMIDFVKTEVQDILDGEAKDSDGEELKQEFLDYRDKLAAGLSVENVEKVEKTAKFEIQDEPMRFYIGSASDSSEGASDSIKETKPVKKAAPKKLEEPEKEPEAIKKPEAEPVSVKPEKKKTEKAEPVSDTTKKTEKGKPDVSWLKDNSSITGDDLENLFDLVNNLSSLEERLMGRCGGDFEKYSDLLGEFHEINIALLDWITTASNIPIGHISVKLQRTVDEMNNRLGRNTSIILEGENVIVDRKWVDKISGALVHMIRNSVDHGIESKEKRLDIGKPAEGVIKISYKMTDNRFVLELSDDGRGIDTEGLRNKALERGITEAETAETPEEIMQLMFIPGVSTNEKEGIYSGRGVGMDVVKHNIEELGGTISVASEIGKGTAFTISIPLVAEDGEEMSGYEDFDSRR